MQGSGRRGFGHRPGGTGAGGAGGGGGGREKMRTHMIMFSGTGVHDTRRSVRKSKKKPLHPTAQQQDASVQTHGHPQTVVDPQQWSGNQRVVHYGPMGTRDPFYYFFPKGWDSLYPAHFGFFPYRTNKYRGSSPAVCLTAFGFFFTIGGAAMTYLGFWLYPLPKGFYVHQLQIIGPVMLLFGVICLISGCCLWMCGLQLCNEHLRHTQPHHKPPRKAQKQYEYEKLPTNYMPVDSPYHPPPPLAATVLANAYTHSSLYNPEQELKLYPPSLPTTLTRGSTVGPQFHSYAGSPYNTLSSLEYAANLNARHGAAKPTKRAFLAAPPSSKKRSSIDEGDEVEIFENLDAEWPEYHASAMSRFDEPRVPPSTSAKMLEKAARRGGDD